MENLKVLTLLIIPFLLSVLFVFLVRKWALKHEVVSYPREDRWNKKPVALLGGIGIFIAFFLSYILLFSEKLSFHFSLEEMINPNSYLVILTGSCMSFVLGLLDDLTEMKPQTKFICQLVIAGMMIFWGFRLSWFKQPLLDMLVTIFWVIGVVNSFNLIDNMDGLSSVVAIIAGLAFSIVYKHFNLPWSQLGLLIAGVAGGFLIYNFPPASIFMGDSGSLFLGFLLSIMPLNRHGVISHHGMAWKYVFIPILILIIPIFDTTFVTLNRFIHNRKISRGGCDHTSHRLVMIGFSERITLSLFVFTSILSAIAAWSLVKATMFLSLELLVPFFFILIVFGILISQIQVYTGEEEIVFYKNRTSLNIFEWMYKKQLFFILFDVLIISFSYYLAYRIRFPGIKFHLSLSIFLRTLPLLIICKMLSFYFLGIYERFWGFISIEDAMTFVKANLIGTASSIVLLTFVYRFRYISRVIFVLDFFFCILFMLSFRMSKRLFWNMVTMRSGVGEKVLIYGAGQGGDLLVRELLNNKKYCMHPCGFIDDDPVKLGKKMHGIKIIGSIKDIEHILGHYEFDGIVISFKNIDKSKLSRIKDLAKKEGLFIKEFKFVLDDVVIADKNSGLKHKTAAGV